MSANQIQSAAIPTGERYFTRSELAQILKVSVRTVDSLIAGNEIPVVRVKTVVRFRLEDVEKWLSNGMNAVNSTPDQPRK